MSTLSLCMIVKDEEAVLGRCLDSIKEAVDEIIIVDTGSQDKTKEIAAIYTNRIYDFPWRDDFAAARNFSFSKANMDYILWLDADDVLTEENKVALIHLKQQITADVVMMQYQTAFDEDGVPTFSYYRERIIKRTVPHIWKGRVHEAIEVSGQYQYSDIAIQHQSIKTTYSDRNLRIYETQLAENEPLSPRDTFYYGRELYYHRHYLRAVEVLLGFLNEEKGWVENKIEACRILSYCYSELMEPQKALDALLATFRYDSPRAEVCCEIGNIWLHVPEYQIAAYWYELALHAPRKDQAGGFVDENSHGYLPCIQLCVCYDRLGNLELAETYNNMAGKFRPHAQAYLENVKYFHKRNSDTL